MMKIGLLAVALAFGQAHPVEEPVRFRVAASGDFLIHTPVAARARALGGGSRYDFAPMFDPVKRHIEGADLALCHVETPLVPGPPTGYPVFRTPVGLAGAIKRVGWDSCSTASNHSLDVGEYGIRTTLRALDRNRILHHGTARSPAERRRAAVADVKGLKVAFLAYTAISNGQVVPNPWNLNWASAGRIVADAKRAKRQGADAVIVNLHWGNEYQHAISPLQLSLARSLTRSPAVTAIVGQHAHVVQPIRRINGKPVVFGEGNLVSNQTAACCPAASQDGLIALIDFVAWPGAPVKATRIRYVPTYVSHPDYSVQPAAPGSGSWNRTVSVAGRRPGIRPLR
ncbi:MAG TPA: CapA family protein [Thermoleophilaceae bacterium]|jgi:poly-gamma-glutamate capsule biosynthesis protein CapA/YwtB (metallophosphatase superfamily)|nr:CapA family protein [Thermoleophilaceae bacterium]